MSNVDCTVINSEPRMTHLDLSHTNIKEIPNNIVNLNELRIINFRGNDLNGEIPTFFDKLIHLEEIDLSENKFYGQIPKSFLNIKNLTYLDISSNRLFGIIPSEFCDMEKLKDIRYNNNMNSVYPSSCIRSKFGYSYNNYVRFTRWIVFIGIIVIIVVFGIINLVIRQNKIKSRIKRLSQRRLLRESRSRTQMRKMP
ncbi:L domain-like protein [Anaeromyces robustus]|uniref:L domain-like protein n=1 Tax=Anaeromyces robustus TaxID=1754192 RepID=A0A1Y1WSI5_9FUNG|nr:L domain-like protein [Anaeromyces robustus]|eukprot:ORX76499.1 L domain-like protein [Anaeromyces robustus]